MTGWNAVLRCSHPLPSLPIPLGHQSDLPVGSTLSSLPELPGRLQIWFLISQSLCYRLTPSPPCSGAAGRPGSPCITVLPSRSLQHTQQPSLQLHPMPMLSPPCHGWSKPTAADLHTPGMEQTHCWWPSCQPCAMAAVESKLPWTPMLLQRGMSSAKWWVEMHTMHGTKGLANAYLFPPNSFHYRSCVKGWEGRQKLETNKKKPTPQFSLMVPFSN